MSGYATKTTIFKLQEKKQIYASTRLKSWLWDSANILRGRIDSSDFKNYIFGLLFLKRVNDVFDEEIEARMKQEGISCDDAEDEVYFYILQEACWNEIKKVTENIGVVLDKAFAAMEREIKTG